MSDSRPPSAERAAAMNRAKSIFVGLYPGLVTAIVGVSCWRLIATRGALAWWGPLATTAPFFAFLTFSMAFKRRLPTRPSFPLPNLLALCGVALAAHAWLTADAGVAPLALALVGATTLAAYSFWYAWFGRAPSERIAVGRALPDFELRRADGSPFHAAELRGAPALLLFFRGNWCPLCMAQVKEIAARYREIAAMGARVALVSPQPHAQTIALAKRFDVPLDFLEDPESRAAQALDIAMRNGVPMGLGRMGYSPDTVFPTVIVTDKHGVVRWLDQTDNYRIRPEPDTFLPLLRSLAEEEKNAPSKGD